MAKDHDAPIIPQPREHAWLFGHAAAEQRFLTEVARGVTHHAYLMTGPQGIGKATLAYRFARFMLAQKKDAGPSLFGDTPAIPATLAMDAESPFFRRIAAGSHSDLLVLSPSIDPKKGVERAEITAEEARIVPDFLSLTPAEGDWRIVIVDAVDQLNTHAANALLKVLEEPPERAMLFLVCHAPGGILSTIRSRCRHFRLIPPDHAAFEQVLATVAPHIERADYPPLYALAYGSPGFAITLAAHEALAIYELWLSALLPQATAASKQMLADKAAAAKTPQAWELFLHGWQTLLYRASLYPSLAATVSGREEECLKAITTALSPQLRQRWVTAGRALLAATDTFNLDKRSTIRLLLDPQRLDTLMAA